MNPLTIINHNNNQLCSVNLILPIGQIHDPIHLVGITHLIEHLIFHAHPSLKQEELMRKIEERGGIFNIVTEKEMTIIYGKVHYRFANEIINLFQQAIRNLPNSISLIENERKIILNEIKSHKRKQYQIMSDYQQKKLFNDHPYSFNQAIKNNLLDIKKEDVLSFIEHYRWENWKVLIVGNLKEEDIDVEVIGKNPNIVIPSATPLLNFKYQKQNNVGGIIVSIPLSEYLDDLDTIIIKNFLFGGIASPFYSEIVKQQSISYKIESSVRIYQDKKFLEFGWLSQSENIDKSLDLMLEIKENFLTKKIFNQQDFISALERTRTSILLIHENFLRYTSHLEKQVALRTFQKPIFQDDYLSVKDFPNLIKVLFSQPMLIGIHGDFEGR